VISPTLDTVDLNPAEDEDAAVFSPSLVKPIVSVEEHFAPTPPNPRISTAAVDVEVDAAANARLSSVQLYPNGQRCFRFDYELRDNRLARVRLQTGGTGETSVTIENVSAEPLEVHFVSRQGLDEGTVVGPGETKPLDVSAGITIVHPLGTRIGTLQRFWFPHRYAGRWDLFEQFAAMATLAIALSPLELWGALDIARNVDPGLPPHPRVGPMAPRPDAGRARRYIVAWTQAALFPGGVSLHRESRSVLVFELPPQEDKKQE